MPPRPNKRPPPNAKNLPKKHPIDKKEPAPTTLLDTNNTIPLPLQQLLLNVFQSALLPNVLPSTLHDTHDAHNTTETDTETLDVKPLIQTLKAYLYNRDFDAAFTDANDELLRAYALRWSAARALGYVGVFKAVLGDLLRGQSQFQTRDEAQSQVQDGHIVCIGGGAGAEIVALGGVWRDMASSSSAISTVEDTSKEKDTSGEKDSPGVTITAVDIADWTSVVDRLDTAMRSGTSGSRSYPPPLLPGQYTDKENVQNEKFDVTFQRENVLDLADDQLQQLYNSQGQQWTLVTLMFTLNELFSTSVAKTTAFLLRTTDALLPETYLLVVDSPGSYSSLTLGNSAERRYPMKFLLDHTLLTVAEGKWEKVVSEDSRWWRRDADRLGYDVGGVGLEDMRFQVHLYRRLA